MIYHALDRHALEPPMPHPFTVVARHRPGLILLVALLAPLAAWTRHPALLVSAIALLALLGLRLRLAAAMPPAAAAVPAAATAPAAAPGAAEAREALR
ncbi:hypothetical protein [Cryptosporangium sp. NPDC048952]|uniref:hypothetical protein n=1 Tax=Cryptosporangium sp. NPDC048952 TaxID=3363961 RepID=UPI003715882E